MPTITAQTQNPFHVDQVFAPLLNRYKQVLATKAERLDQQVAVSNAMDAIYTEGRSHGLSSKDTTAAITRFLARHGYTLPV